MSIFISGYPWTGRTCSAWRSAVSARVVERFEIEQMRLDGRAMRAVPFSDVFFRRLLVPFQRGLRDGRFRDRVRELRSGNEQDLAGDHRDFLAEGGDMFLGKTHVLSPLMSGLS